MKDVTTSNFGLLIAFVLPGLILLWGIAPYSETLNGWLGETGNEQPTVGGFLYVTLASVGLGQFVSTVRWLVIDTIHHITGIRQPDFDFSNLSDAVHAFDRLIEIHYRYYQWHSNCLVAILAAVPLRWISTGFHVDEFLLLIVVGIILVLGSRDTLRKYYRRVDAVLRRDA